MQVYAKDFDPPEGTYWLFKSQEMGPNGRQLVFPQSSALTLLNEPKTF